MGQTLKSAERIRPVINREDLKTYVRLEAKTNSKLAPFHRKWNYSNFVQILRADGIMAQSYVRATEDILQKEEVVGFILYRLHDEYFEILNLVAEHNRPDVIEKLLQKMKDKTGSKRFAIEFTVRETDDEWHAMLREAGFQAKLVRGYFDHPVEDGYKFKWEKTYDNAK